MTLFAGIPAGNAARAAEAEPLAAPAFDNEDSTFTNAGSIRLSWSPGEGTGEDPGLRFELQKADDPGFRGARTDYAGPDRATYVSGLPDGRYHYRVRAVDAGGRVSPWSMPVQVAVAHHSMGLAWLLFGIGAIVFALTVLVVVRGARSDDSRFAEGG